MCAGAGRQAELALKGYSSAGYRAAAADPRYRIAPPVYAVLTSNIEHTVCCRPQTRDSGLTKQAKILPCTRWGRRSTGYEPHPSSARMPRYQLVGCFASGWQPVRSRTYGSITAIEGEKSSSCPSSPAIAAEGPSSGRSLQSMSMTSGLVRRASLDASSKEMVGVVSVSYTHLTLPTICSV